MIQIRCASESMDIKKLCLAQHVQTSKFELSRAQTEVSHLRSSVARNQSTETRDSEDPQKSREENQRLDLHRPAVLFAFSLDLTGCPLNFRVKWRRALHGATRLEKASSFRAVELALREQCGREREQDVALPVTQIQEGIAKLLLEENLSADMDDIVGARRTGARPHLTTVTRLLCLAGWMGFAVGQNTVC